MPADAQAFGGLTENGTAAFMGIGVNPTKILHVSGSGPGTVPLFVRGTDSAGFIIERTPTNRWVFGVNEDAGLGNGFVLSTFPTGSGSSTPRLLVSQNGRVGIGTNILDNKLNVLSDGSAAVYGEHAIGNYGYLASGLYGAYGSVANNALYYGVYGKHNGSQNYGYLGGAEYGAYGYSSDSAGVSGVSSSGNGVEGETTSGKAVYGINYNRNNEGYLGSTDYAVYGLSASDYAGYFAGKVKVLGSLATAYRYVSSSSNALPTDSIIGANCVSQDVAIQLPDAAGCSGRAYTVKRLDSTGYNLVIFPDTGDTIDGAANYYFDTGATGVYDFVTIVSDGNNWLIVSEKH